MSSALRHASAVKTRPSSVEMTALSVTIFGIQLDTTLLLRCHPIAKATLSGYVNKNEIILHTCVQCVLTYVTRHQLAVPCAICVCDYLPQLVLHYNTSNDSFTSRVPVRRQTNGCVFYKCRCRKIQSAQL